MSAVAVLLIAVGIADICRRAVPLVWVSVAAGPVTVVALAGLAALWHPGDIALLLVAIAAVACWELLCERAERSGGGQVRPLVTLGVAVAVLILLSGWGSRVGGVVAGWFSWADLPGLEPTRALMVCGVVLLQFVTGNRLVRLLLSAIGSLRPAGQPQPSDHLKGGRLLGPMERVMIVGLGLAGQLAASTAVIAAKSIIRFPEINAQRKNGATGDPATGIDDVTEYFLIGSFASWLLALTGLALVGAVPP